MALISCPECRREVSINAAACPHCGNPMASHSVPQGSAESYTSRATHEARRKHLPPLEEGAIPVDIALPPGPKCYACSAQATTRCQSCGALSCAVHLKSIFVSHGKGGAYELRCERCYSSAQAGQVFGWIVGAIILIMAAIFFFGFWLPGWNQARQPHDAFKQEHDAFKKKFDENWKRIQKHHDEFNKKFDENWNRPGF